MGRRRWPRGEPVGMIHSMATATPPSRSTAPRQEREQAVRRFAGDSGDGMQITGSQFTVETALAGNDLATFPDFPAEIRAPAGTTFGVSAFQIHFGSTDILTAGDELDVLVAMNPARSEEHTSELQSPCNLVCRLLLEKKKKNIKINIYDALLVSRTAVTAPDLVDA